MTFTAGQVLTASQMNTLESTANTASSNATTALAGLNKFEATLTAGEELVDGNLCYLKSDGKMWKADADAEASANTLLGMCKATIHTDAIGTFLLRGPYTTSGLTAGSIYFVSGTAGAITASVPSGSGDIVRVVGYALSTTILYFTPDETFIEV